MKLISLSGSTLGIESIPETDTIRLTRSLILMDEDTGKIYGFPAGFECDGESIPGLFPETAAGDAGGIPHDWMYRFAWVFVWSSAARHWVRHPVTRAFADEFYRATCAAFGGWGWWASAKKWAGLRLSGIGWINWARARRRARVWTGGEPSVCFPGGVEPCPAGSAS